MLLAFKNVNIEEVKTVNKLILNFQKDFSSVEIVNAVMTAKEIKKSFVLTAHLYEATVEKLINASQLNN